MAENAGAPTGTFALRLRGGAGDADTDDGGSEGNEELAAEDLLEPTAAEWQRVLSEPIGQATRSISRGVLREGGREVRVTEPRGKHFQLLGEQIQPGVFSLTPAEALYLMQLGMLEVTGESGVPASMQEMLSLALAPGAGGPPGARPRPRGMPELLAWANLQRQGYVALPRRAAAGGPLHFDVYKPTRRKDFRLREPGPPDYHLFAMPADGEAPDARALDAMRAQAAGGAPLLAAALDAGRSIGIYEMSTDGVPALTAADRVPSRPARPRGGRGGGRGRGRGGGGGGGGGETEGPEGGTPDPPPAAGGGS